jgi:arylsulfatase A-like enzyme
VVVGDHGESLGEHDEYFTHGSALWEQSVHVPMIVRWPGRLEGGQTSDDLVSVRAAARVALQAAGVESPAPISPEPNVLIYTTGQEPERGVPRRSVEPERQLAALRYHRGKLLARGGTPAAWFDLAADPGETTPLPVPAALVSDASTLEKLVNAAPPRLTDHQRRRLEALGYLE